MSWCPSKWLYCCADYICLKSKHVVYKHKSSREIMSSDPLYTHYSLYKSSVARMFVFIVQEINQSLFKSTKCKKISSSGGEMVWEPSAHAEVSMTALHQYFLPASSKTVQKIYEKQHNVFVLVIDLLRSNLFQMSDHLKVTPLKFPGRNLSPLQIRNNNSKEHHALNDIFFSQMSLGGW